MSEIILKIDDGKSDMYCIDEFDVLLEDLDLSKVDGGDLVLLTSDRAVGARTSIKLKKGDEKPAKKAAKKAAKKTKGSK